MISHKDLILGALLHDIGKALVDFRVQNYTDFHLHPNDNFDRLIWKLENIWRVLKNNDIIDPFIVKCILFHHWLNQSINFVANLINGTNISNDEKNLLLSYFKEIKPDEKELLEIISKVDKVISDETREESSGNNVKIIYPWSIFKKEKYSYMYGLKDILNTRFKDIPIDMNEYRKEWLKKYQKDFLKELKLAYKLKNPNVILLVLYKYLFFFPESLKDLNEVSLAHHLKYTALLADLYYKEVKEGKNTYLIIIDIVGTHKFINSLLRDKKEIGERGKYLQKINAGSRFVEILTALVIAKVLEKSKSYITNIINLSTNGAVLLVALSKEEKEKIEEWVKDLNNVLLKLTLGQLYVSIYFESIKEKLGTTIEKIINEGRVGKLIEWLFKDRNKELSERKEKLEDLEFKYLDKEKLILDIERAKNDYEQFIDQLLRILGRWIYRDKPITKISKELFDVLFLGKLEEIPDFEIVSWEIILDEGIEKVNIEKEIVVPLFLRNGRETKELRDIVIKKLDELNIPEDIKREVKEYGISFDVLKSARDFRRIGILKIDGDKVGKLFSEWLKDELTKKEYSLIVLAYLSEILQFAFKYVTLDIAEKINRNNIDSLAFVFVVYSSGDELTVVGDIEELLEYYREFIKKKKKILFDIIKTSAAFAYVHYKHPFRFVYEKMNELVEKAKENKDVETFEIYLSLTDTINIQEKVTLGCCFETWLSRTYSYVKLIEDRKLPRTRITNMEMIIERILEELKKDKASSVIYLVYYASKDYEEYFKDLLNEIKKKFSLENKEETMEMLNYWLSIFDYVKTVTRS